ncbi:MAG: hypothetical protein HKN06_03790 [Gammaproteobacteria bacterium]|nr:hypothetical protein [Gammaproteobacteria bacterium]
MKVFAIVASGLAALLLLPVGAVADNAMRAHMRHLLNDGDQWLADNPQYDPERGGPAAFGLQFRLQPDGSHIVGELGGVFEDGKRATYWTLYALYNPVTEKVVTQQIGWDGTLVYGEVPVQPGKLQIIDMIRYGADGTLSISRHENIYDNSDTHTSIVYSRNGAGWSQDQVWEWRRHPLEKAPERARVSPGSKPPAQLERQVGHLLAGSGRWRAPNPDFSPGSGTEKFYGMNYRWGPHRQHVIGEIVSIYEDGRQTKDWSKYIIFNPVTEKVYMQQTGSRGVYFEGELGEQDGRKVHAGLIYIPNGTLKSVRDEIEIIDDNTFVSHVFERDASGGWTKKRQWTWTLQPGAQ